MSDLSEYEKQRLEHIKRNHEMLVRLGLEPEAKETPEKKPKQKRAKPPPPLPETLRRSSRAKQIEPEYTKETIDQFGEELDRQCEPRAQKRQKRDADADADDEEERVRAEIAASSVAFLRAAREAMDRRGGPRRPRPHAARLGAHLLLRALHQRLHLPRVVVSGASR